MPRRRAYKKKYKKRSTYQKYNSYAQTAVKALRIANQVRQLVNTEFHHYDAKLGSTGVTWNGAIYDLCLPAVGDGDEERTGDSIRLKNLKLQGHISYNTLGSATQTVTLMIFLDKANKYGLASDILDQGEIGTQWAPYAPKDKDNTFNTKTLWKKTFVMSDQRDFTKIFAKLDNLNWHMQFENGTTIPNTNRLRLLVISDTNANLPALTFFSRVSFIDN